MEALHIRGKEGLEFVMCRSITIIGAYSDGERSTTVITARAGADSEAGDIVPPCTRAITGNTEAEDQGPYQGARTRPAATVCLENFLLRGNRKHISSEMARKTSGPRRRFPPGQVRMSPGPPVGLGAPERTSLRRGRRGSALLWQRDRGAAQRPRRRQ